MCLDDQTSNLKSYEVRLKTFEKWNSKIVSPEDLAKCGFFNLNYRDFVSCSFCNLILGQWKIGDTPIGEHKKYKPNCPMVKEIIKTETPNELKCRICEVNKIEVLFIPCQHFSVCSKCKRLSYCPFCGKKINKFYIFGKRN